MVTSSLTVINAISTLSLSLCKCMLFLTVNYPNKSIRMIMRVGMAMINELENADDGTALGKNVGREEGTGAEEVFF